MSISAGRTCVLGERLRNRAWGSSKHWSSCHSSDSALCMISSEEGSVKILTTRDTAAGRHPRPQVSNPGIHLLKPESMNFLDQSAPGLTAWKKWPVRKYNGSAFCWKFRNYTKLQTPLGREVQQPGQALCYSHVHPRAQDCLCEKAMLGLSSFLLQLATHTSCLCMHCSSLEPALNQCLFWIHLKCNLSLLIHLFWGRARLLYILFFESALLIPCAVTTK